MAQSNRLSLLVLEKIKEQIERTRHLIGRAPSEKLDWRPLENSARLGDLLGHLLECVAGFCATLYAMQPDRLSHFEQLRSLPVNHYCGIEEAVARLEHYVSCVGEGFELVEDSDLTKPIKTVFVPDGEPALSLMLGNLEHLINHKYQLFFYLKQLGVDVSTPDLYRLKNLSDGSQPLLEDSEEKH